MSSSQENSQRPPRFGMGLCSSCIHVRVIRSAKGSEFLLCGMHATDDRFSKYPPQPVVQCRAWEERT